MKKVQNTRIYALKVGSRHLKFWILLLFINLWSSFPLFSQSFQSKIDSLSMLLKETSQDTVKLDVYHKLFQYYTSTNPKKLLSLADKALALAKENNRESDMATWYNNKSIYYRLQNIADSALHYNLEALRINEKLQNQAKIADNLINAGLIYHDIKNYNKALSFLRRGIVIKKKLNDTFGLMKGYINTGIVFFAQKELDSALSYYSKSLIMAEQLKDHKGILLNKMNIGSIYYEQKDWESAKNSYLETVQLCKKMGEKEIHAAALINMGLVYKELKSYDNAILYLEDAIKMAEETGSKSDLAEANYNLSEVHKLTGNYKEAYNLHKQYSKSKTAIEENAKGVADIQTDYEVEKKEAIIKVKDQSIMQESGMRKKVIWVSSILVLVLISISGFIFVQKQKLAGAKKQVELENKILGNTNMQMKARMHELITAMRDNKGHLPVAKKEKYRTSTLSTEQKQQYMEVLLDYMDKEKPHLDPELTLNSLGEVLSLKPHHLSEVLNEALGKNFYDFVNMYRIEIVKEKMADPEASKFKLLALAFDSGFNSKTAFNRAFKKVTGLAPSRYREKHIGQPQTRGI